MGSSFEFPASEEEYQACKQDPECDAELDLWAQRKAAEKKFTVPANAHELAQCMSNTKCKDRFEQAMLLDPQAKTGFLEQMKIQYADEPSLQRPDQPEQTPHEKTPDKEPDPTVELLQGLSEEIPVLGPIIKVGKTANEIRKGEMTPDKLLLDQLTGPLGPVLAIGEAQNKLKDKARKSFFKEDEIRAPEMKDWYTF